jgi:hypothetical protein
MPVTSLQDARALPDPLYTYQWDVIIAALPGSPNSRSLTYKATSTSIPGSMLEEVAVNLAGVELRYAGRQNYSHSFALTLHETRDTGSIEMMRRWQRIARDNNLNTGTYKEMYSTSVELILYDDLNTVVRTITLVGCWPQTIDDAALDRASGAVSISTTLSYDFFTEST